MREQTWRKSSYSGDYGNCAEVAATTDATSIRDSKAPDTGHLQVPKDRWSSFLSRLKAGHYDL